jgi:ATP-dependent Lon protease
MQLSNYNAFPEDIPIIVEKELFLYPFMISPIFLSDDQSISAINQAIENNSLIMVCAAKDNTEINDFDDFYDAGVIGTIMRKVVLPDKRIKVLFQGLTRGSIIEAKSTEPFVATVDVIPTMEYDEERIEAMLESLRENVKTLSSISNFFPPDLLNTITESSDPSRIIDLIASTIRLKKDQAYKLFILTNIEQRLMLLIEYVIQTIEHSKLQKEIKSKVHTRIDKVNREYFLKEQLKQIRRELGEDSQREEEIEEYYEKLKSKQKHMPEETYKEINKQIDRLSRMHADSADANILQTYLEWSLEIPFGKISKGKLDIAAVEKKLDDDHYSLEKPKERITEFFAVKELLELRGIASKESRGTIICFAGPPGVGKTSLANSIAKALKRELVRVALGGLEDVNELRGHRRTYIGAMPGRLIQGIINAKTMNPVIVLDEIDKVGRSMRGDPTAALLEVLDPEQNDKFRDYYLNFDIDLSQVIFITTANDLGSIPAPLRDRLEIIMVSSYTPQEKYEIAKRYLFPQELKKHGLKKSELSISTSALKELIEKHTREAGVRNLRRKLATLLRKSATRLLRDSSIDKISITNKNLHEFVEKEVFSIDLADKKDSVGIVNGLAWTAVGGDVLKIEAIRIEGKGGLQLTGSLGDVMKESAKIALSVIKTLIDTKQLTIDIDTIPLLSSELTKEASLAPSDIYRRYDLHIHVPEGATPKDGPSAGITMATVIASILSGKAVRADLAMTGELTLTGKVLPIGGLKEKLIAAHKAKIKIACIPQKNFDQDLAEIPDEVKENIEIIAVKSVLDVLKIALAA